MKIGSISTLGNEQMNYLIRLLGIFKQGTLVKLLEQYSSLMKY